MTHEQLLETFGAGGALRLPDSGVAHEPARPRPINTDISTVALAQWLIRRVQLLDPVHDLLRAEAALVANLVRILGVADPVACRPLADDGDRRYWPELFEDGSAAGIY
ncbi:SUKH-4 family immunity protein [Actinomadura geliboluensis]|uniref:SUKH-4 family immunity protein n=1 Tax=Actinomadura geliboluensis TaxID=882440 RepID=UPI0036BA7964